jgi:hypothetical protein
MEMNSITKLIRVIERSELAYQLYLKEKKYFQAIRIYNSNKMIYTILESMLLEDNSLDKKKIVDFLFHLDDWFSQFNETLESRSFVLNEMFVFERIEGMFPFPKDFVLMLKNQS